MNEKNLITMRVGDIVANNFSTAKVFKNLGIDFCCHGEAPLKEACEKAHLSSDEVIEALTHASETSDSNIPFEEWPLDLLIDYVIKIHHRGIRQNGPRLLELIKKVRDAHGANHPELNELYLLVAESLNDLDSHLGKEENVLFPYLYELYNSSENGDRMMPMHCGTISNPIRVMRMEHETEGNRYLHIRELTNGFKVPEDGCASYRLMMEELEAFVDALFEHIHIENNILFPGFQKLEEKWVG